MVQLLPGSYGTRNVQFTFAAEPDRNCEGGIREMPKIATSQELQTVLTTFEVTPGTCQDILEELQEAYAVFISKQPGFIAKVLHRQVKLR